ncbi:glycosyltransferase 87 family protein [Constantimarinum sp. W242]|uniref:Glycosyltransferase 87 family protein n=1 Tax=Patiriisocius hiemis TaxID=3075604 RepID=A0ABU2YEU9_9FLAO|nr:glycosyltransferase 87 family protein [Constantimarinum sp. W242]MDT0556305.1 glycosyltransferase 87 family protein [Constantimarinum sp. W242]
MYGALFILSWQLIKFLGHQFWVLAGIGIVFRLIAFPSIPNLSQDFYRFIWDGRLLVQGVNPYLFTPEQFINNVPPKTLLSSWSLDSWFAITMHEADTLFKGMGSLNASHYSNYPPVNQLCFAIAGFFSGKSILGSVIILRIITILADIGILYFGKKLLEKLQLPTTTIFWYFINPFIIIELTGNLHFEGVMLSFLIWGLYLLHQKKWFWAAVLIGLSISVKLIPLLLLPVFLNYFIKKNTVIQNEAKCNEESQELKKKIPLGITKLILFYLVIIATILITFAPFLSSVFIKNFTTTISLWFQNFEFNASIYYIIRWIGFKTVGWNIIGTVGKILPIIVILFLLGISFFRKHNTTQQLITGLLFGITFYFLFSTTVHPWYVATPLVLSVFTKYRFPIVWSALVMLSYSAYEADGFNENLWLVSIEYTVVILYAMYEISNSQELGSEQLPKSL